MADKSYVVKAASAMVYNTDRTSAVTLSKGDPVPAGANEEHLQLLLGRGIVEEGTAEGGVQADPDAAPPFPLPDDAQSKARAKADK